MKRFAITTALAIGLMIAILALATGGMGWPDLEDPARQGEALDAAALRQGRIVHSQAAAARLIREPENTWSNLAFVIVGAVLFSLYPRRRARLVGVALIGVGLGSFAYHASASRTLRHLDVGAMYGLYVATTALAAAALSPALARGIGRQFWTIAAVAGVFAITAAGCRNYVILGGKPFALEPMTAVAAAILIAALVWVAIRERSAQRSARVIAALALFGAALICQI